MASSILQAFGTSTALTITNLNSLATSVTAGWGSDPIDNTSTLYTDFLVEVTIAAVNTAPANNKAFYVYAAGLVDSSGTSYATTGATSGGTPGSQGALTFPDITANPVNIPLIGVIPYVGQNTLINSAPLSVSAAYNGVIPPKFCLAIVNYSGMTIASSGNVVAVRGVYRTVG